MAGYYVETATIKAAEATGLNAGRAAQQVFGGRVKLFARQSFELEYEDVGMDDAVGLGPVIGPESVLSNPKTALSQMDLSSSFTSRQAVMVSISLEEISTLIAVN